MQSGWRESRRCRQHCSQDSITGRDVPGRESGTVPKVSWGTEVAPLCFGVLCLLNCTPLGIVLLQLCSQELCYLLLVWNINILHIPGLSSFCAAECACHTTVIRFSVWVVVDNMGVLSKKISSRN